MLRIWMVNMVVLDSCFIELGGKMLVIMTAAQLKIRYNDAHPTSCNYGRLFGCSICCNLNGTVIHRSKKHSQGHSSFQTIQI